MPMLIRLLLIVMTLLPATSFAAPVILVYGDSLSASYGIPRDKSWTHLLQQRLAQSGYPHIIANASISGETTSGGLSRIEKALLDHRPAVVVLELGANDGLRGLPVTDMRRNLTAIIETCRRHKANVLLIGMQIPPNYGPRYTQDFLETYPALAKKFHLPLLEFMLDGIAGHRELIQEDGLHPTAAAQPMLLDNLWSKLQPLLEKSIKRDARK